MNHRRIEELANQAARLKQAIADYIEGEREEGAEITLIFTLREGLDISTYDVLSTSDVDVIGVILTDALATLERLIKHEIDHA